MVKIRLYKEWVVHPLGGRPMKAFLVKGSFPAGERRQSFNKEVAANKKTEVEEFILSDIGSKHKVQRRFIKIDSIRNITPSP